MKDKLIFRKNMLLISILYSIALVIVFAVLVYVTFNIVAEEDRDRFSIAMYMFIPVIPGLLYLLFHQHLRVNDETVAFYKLFKCKQTINWKDATVTQTTKNVNDAVLPTVVISDGAQEIAFPAISDKDLALLNELCNAAHQKYNIDSVTF